jgi:hypothetical protein
VKLPFDTQACLGAANLGQGRLSLDAPHASRRNLLRGPVIFFGTNLFLRGWVAAKNSLRLLLRGTIFYKCLLLIEIMLALLQCHREHTIRDLEKTVAWRRSLLLCATRTPLPYHTTSRAPTHSATWAVDLPALLPFHDFPQER